MSILAKEVWPMVEERPHTLEAIAAVKATLGVKHFKLLCDALLRQVFLVEFSVKNTKVCARWSPLLKGRDIQRLCSFEECLELLTILLTTLPGWLAQPEHLEMLRLFFDNNILSYEVPLDYVLVPEKTDHVTKIHRVGNLDWTFGERMLRTLKLRAFLRNSASTPDAKFFRKVLNDKIKIKTYLTDRAQTGDYKTNREKRWEAHPHSPQFATRTEAMAIEYTLITQLCAFKDFPAASLQILQAEGVLPVDLPTLVCPITLEPMSFPQFRDALMNPQHGRSDFQVGHLNPLKVEVKSDEVTADAAGHTANNISWISADGNRIQGSLSLNSVRELLRKIGTNYEQLGLIGRPTAMDTQAGTLG